MTQPDVVLIHPPSVYDFRERSISFGPISDVIPSSPVFEMYPVGFLTLAAHLRRHGYRVRIVNLALLMMRSARFDAEQFLRRLNPRLFGIDLHWLPHAQGGAAVAAMLKRLHPHIPIVFGGISATYYHQELIRNEAVDFVVRGSVAEPSLLALVR
ncbi:MAG: cobalamin-dependent protein, partial [Thermoanaerobaculia bacterium]